MIIFLNEVFFFTNLLHITLKYDTILSHCHVIPTQFSLSPQMHHLAYDYQNGQTNYERLLLGRILIILSVLSGLPRNENIIYQNVSQDNLLGFFSRTFCGASGASF